MSALSRARHGLERLRFTIAAALLPRRRVVSRGLSLTLSCDNAITAFRWRSYNEKEPETLDWIDTALVDGDVFLDVGANVGVYSLYAALRHPRLRVIAIEPEYTTCTSCVTTSSPTGSRSACRSTRSP